MTVRNLAVFDFDHTLTMWDTSARFFVWLIRRSAWKSGLVLLALPLLGPLLLARRTRKLPIRFGAWVATLGVSIEHLPHLSREHVAGVICGGEKFVRKDALARVRHHLDHGHEVVVATGSLEVLVREILKVEGLSEIEVVGSTVRSFLGGMVTKEHCFGGRKIPMLLARGFASPFAFAYSDHEADLPLLRNAMERYIINPNRRSAEVLAAELGESAVVLLWE